jgi:hypothetical protein
MRVQRSAVDSALTMCHQFAIFEVGQAVQTLAGRHGHRDDLGYRLGNDVMAGFVGVPNAEHDWGLETSRIVYLPGGQLTIWR